MQTDRLLQVIGIMRNPTPEPTDDVMRYWHEGWNAGLDALAAQVRLEDAVMTPIESRERCAGLADFADDITRMPSVEADWGRS